VVTDWDQTRIGIDRAELKRETPRGELRLDRIFRDGGSWVPHDLQLEDTSDSRTSLVAPNGWDGRYAQDEANILEAFCRLADSPPGAVLRFAKRYGLLMLCEHDRPCSHNPIGTHIKGVDLSCRPTFSEPISVWQHFSRQVRALIAIAARCHMGKTGTDTDWAVVYEWSDSPHQAPWWVRTAEADRAVVTQVINELFDLIMMYPTYDCNRKTGRVSIGIAGYAVLGAVVRELAFAVGRIDGLYTCTGCQKGFVPTRRIPKSRNPWCEDCRGTNTQSNFYKRRQRARTASEQGVDSQNER
jgi:hypothetical protein